MITGKQFIDTHKDEIEKEVKAIMDYIFSESELTTIGYLSSEWTLDFAPLGAICFIANKLQSSLFVKDWACDSQVDIQFGTIKFKVYPKI